PGWLESQGVAHWSAVQVPLAPQTLPGPQWELSVHWTQLQFSSTLKCGVLPPQVSGSTPMPAQGLGTQVAVGLSHISPPVQIEASLTQSTPQAPVEGRQ